MVRCIVDLISKLAEACSPALMLRAAANVAVHALTELSPRSSAVRGLCERAERSGGRCEVAGMRDAGTTVRLECPMAAGRMAREAQTWNS